MCARTGVVLSEISVRQWQGLPAIGKVVGERHLADGSASVDARYFLLSGKPSAERFGPIAECSEALSNDRRSALPSTATTSPISSAQFCPKRSSAFCRSAGSSENPSWLRMPFTSVRNCSSRTPARVSRHPGEHRQRGEHQHLVQIVALGVASPRIHNILKNKENFPDPEHAFPVRLATDTQPACVSEKSPARSAVFIEIHHRPRYNRGVRPHDHVAVRRVGYSNWHQKRPPLTEPTKLADRPVHRLTGLAVRAMSALSSARCGPCRGPLNRPSRIRGTPARHERPRPNRHSALSCGLMAMHTSWE